MVFSWCSPCIRWYLVIAHTSAVVIGVYEVIVCRASPTMGVPVLASMEAATSNACA